MLQALIIAFTIYTLIKVYISIMQMGYIIDERSKTPVLMSKEKYIEAANYAISKEKISLTSHIIEYLLFIWWTIIGFGLLYEVVLSYGFNSSMLISILFLVGFFTFDYILSLPLLIYQVFVIDKKYGFTKTTPKLFTLDQIKSITMFFTIGLCIMALLIWIISSFDTWWLYGFLAIMFLILLINFAYPTIIAPMFNKFTPLVDNELQNKIEKLLNNSGMHTNGIFVMDASKRDSKLNAYFGGLGKSKRVVLFDTLIEKLNHNELLAVLGHELGHFKHGDIWKNIALMSILFFGIFFIIGHLPNEIFSELKVEPIAGVVIAFLSLVSSLIAFVWMPIVSLFSRHNEYEADKYGSSVGGGDKNLISALLKLVGENKSFPKSHPLYIFFYYSHPPILERLKELGYDSNNIPEVQKDGIFTFIGEQK